MPPLLRPAAATVTVLHARWLHILDRLSRLRLEEALGEEARLRAHEAVARRGAGGVPARRGR